MFEKHLLALFEGDNLLETMVRYHLSTGGKHLRGHLALAEANALGVPQEKAMTWALACELLHNATLVHDDIQDHDPIRRGQMSLWKRFGVAQAINAGDLLIFKAFEVAAELKTSELPRILAQTAQQLVKGQSDEIEIPSYEPSSGYWEGYKQMCRLKTGTLFQLPIHGIHILGNQESDLNCWLELGVCYQILDDINDYLGLKQPGQNQKDLVELRMNAIVSFLSTQTVQQKLIQDYLSAKPHSQQHHDVIESLQHAVAQENIIGKLQNLAQDCLSEFKKQSSPESFKIIMDLLTKKTPQEPIAHV